jgi:hypothetical protein
MSNPSIIVFLSPSWPSTLRRLIQPPDYRPRLSAKHPSSHIGRRSGPEIVLFLNRHRPRDHRQTVLTPFLAERLSASPLAVLERLLGATQLLPSSCFQVRSLPPSRNAASNEMNTSTASGGSLTSWDLGRRYIWPGLKPLERQILRDRFGWLWQALCRREKIELMMECTCTRILRSSANSKHQRWESVSNRCCEKATMSSH